MVSTGDESLVKAFVQTQRSRYSLDLPKDIRNRNALRLSVLQSGAMAANPSRSDLDLESSNNSFWSLLALATTCWACDNDDIWRS